jgi:ubiquinone/menaquinone biosynthesis C-methylase UbiE
MNSGAVARTCPVCGEARSRPYLDKHGLHLVSCAACSMVYASLVASEYVSGVFYSDAASYYLSEAKLAGDYAPVRFARELSLFRRYCQKGSVLDVGCSTGAFLFQLASRYPGDYEVLGTDVSGAPLDYAESRGVPVARGDFLQMDFGSKRFDAITFWAVLEHLAKPGEFLRRAAELLKPGGLCFVLVPNNRSLAARILGARYRYVYPQHLNYFDRKTLSALVTPLFQVLAIQTTHFNPIIIWQDWRSGGADVANEKRGALLKRTTAFKQSRWLAPVKLGYALAEKCLGWLGLADNLVFVLGGLNNSQIEAKIRLP